MRVSIIGPHVIVVADPQQGIDMRHIGKLAGAALIALAPTMASAQMGAPAGAPMQPGSWGQGGWQSGTPGARYGAAPQGYAQADGGDWHRGPMEHGHGDYRRLERGKHMPRAYSDPSYTVVDWRDWGFAPPGPGMRWVRYYDDGMLVDGDGRIVDARYGVDWDRGHRGPRGGYGRGGYPVGPAGYPGGYAGGPGYGYPAPGVTTFRAGPNTTVTTAVVQAPPPVIVGGPAYGYAGGYGGGYYAGGASVISVTPGVAVTTTTTTTDYETVYKSVAVRRAWRRPIRHYHPRCARAVSCPVLGS